MITTSKDMNRKCTNFKHTSTPSPSSSSLPSSHIQIIRLLVLCSLVTQVYSFSSPVSPFGSSFRSLVILSFHNTITNNIANTGIAVSSSSSSRGSLFAANVNAFSYKYTHSSLSHSLRRRSSGIIHTRSSARRIHSNSSIHIHLHTNPSSSSSLFMNTSYLSSSISDTFTNMSRRRSKVDTSPPPPPPTPTSSPTKKEMLKGDNNCNDCHINTNANVNANTNGNVNHSIMDPEIRNSNSNHLYSYDNHISAHSLKMRHVHSNIHSHTHNIHTSNRIHHKNNKHFHNTNSPSNADNASSPSNGGKTVTALAMSSVDVDMEFQNNNSDNNSSPKKGFASLIMGKNEHSKRRKAAKTILSALSKNISSSSSSSNNNNDNNDNDSNNNNDDNNDNKNKNDSSTTMTKEQKIQMSLLQQENQILRQTIHQLTQENDILKNTTVQLRNDLSNVSNYNQQQLKQLQQQQLQLQQTQLQQKIIIEQFEGEGMPVMNEFGELVDPKSWWENNNNIAENGSANNYNGDLSSSTTLAATTTSMISPLQQKEGQSDVDLEDGQIEITPLMSTTSTAVSVASTEIVSCDEYEDGTCPLEPHLTFQDALRDRAYWLVGLLTLQSMSGFILQRNEELLQTHPIIVYFLTMLVGAGGNAGNQAAVRVIRGIALGTLNDKTQKQFLSREFKMAVALSVVLSVAGFLRAIAFRTPIAETIAVTSALALIVFTSICFGAVLPILLKKIKIDPAHSSTSIQVIMDILGVVLTVLVSTTILDSPFGSMIVSKLSGSS